MIVGGSRGLGHGLALALSAAGARVLVVAAAGAVPPMAPLHEYTREAFSAPWEQDVRIAFTGLGAVLRRPPAPGSVVVVLGSAASLEGSPSSGGYAGAKATVRHITAYARDHRSCGCWPDRSIGSPGHTCSTAPVCTSCRRRDTRRLTVAVTGRSAGTEVAR
jgi:NAD(P)-dependent dehydrogenase (short-subunit alcohol dehydrogenase family)